MAICIETVKSQDAEDIRTPVFIFERLCSIIFPEESDTGEFFLTLDKDPQQEDFLQVRYNIFLLAKIILQKTQVTVGISLTEASVYNLFVSLFQGNCPNLILL